MYKKWSNIKANINQYVQGIYNLDQESKMAKLAFKRPNLH